MDENILKVAYVSATIPSYKVWIVEAMGRRYGDRFFMIHGAERAGTVPRDAGGDINIANNLLVRNRYLSLFGLEITWIPSLSWVIKERPDVLILVDNVRILSNYLIYAVARLRGTRVILYGHGYDHQATLGPKRRLSGVIEKVRKLLLRNADAVIVYGEQGKQHLVERGIKCPIFVADNTLDTAPILAYHDSQNSSQQKSATRQALKIPAEAFLVTFLGRLIPVKKVDFMIELIRRLAVEKGLNVFGLIIGDGPERAGLEEKASGLPMLFDGYRATEQLWQRIRASDVVFIPGMVGLAIIEAFCAGKPLVTVRHDFHGPEICWLEQNVNGVFIEDLDLDKAELAFTRLMSDEELLLKLSRNARISADTKCHPRIMQKAFFNAIEGSSAEN